MVRLEEEDQWSAWRRRINGPIFQGEARDR